MNESELRERFRLHNPWWETGSISKNLAREFKRDAYYQAERSLEENRVFILKGPRRTGKTTILYQIMEKLLKEKAPSLNIFYLSFDDLEIREKLALLFSLYEKERGRLLSQKPKTYIFLDEVQFLPNWESEVKIYFDKKYPIKFFASGSASTLIKKSTESLAGRTTEETLLPFSFSEFVRFKGYLPKKPGRLTDPRKIKIGLSEYLKTGGFPEVYESKEGLALERIKEMIVEKVIYKDLAQLYEIRQPLSLEKTFRFLSENTAQIINVNDLASWIGLSRPTIQNFISYLKDAFLIFTLPKYSRSVKEIIRSMEKAHVIDPILAQIYSKPNEEVLLESTVARHVWEKGKRKTFYWRYKYEVDVIQEIDDDLLPIEVKTTASPNLVKARGLINFCQKYKVKKAVIVYQGPKKVKKVNQKLKIEFIPAWEFLLHS